ncbi:MAG: sensor histidine kinase, partial [Halothece sp.]
MPNISEILDSKLNEVFETWKDKVRESDQIESTEDLSETALENSVKKILDAMVSALSKYSESNQPDFDVVAKASLEHGIHRASQGYNAEEITREYGLLRQTIFDVLEEDLLELPTKEFNRSFRIVDAIIDEASTQCFKQFVQEKTSKVESIKEQLFVTNQELNRLLKNSKQHLSFLAHEIKTPLTSIMGYSQVLLRQQRGKQPEELNINHLDKVLRASRKLLQLVNDSLEMARHESGKVELELEPVDVTEVVGSTMEMIELIAETKGLEIQVNCDRAPEKVIIDRLRLEQIITNLVSNAVRYTDEGVIEVTCEHSENQWCLIVTDTGIGICPEDQENIFEPFSRA